MYIKQISVFMENKPGKLGAITKVLDNGKIDIRAFSIADTCEFGILRIIVREPEKAVDLLRTSGFTAQLSDVLVAVIDDHTGAFNEIVQILSKNDIDIQYLYSFIGEKEPRALVAIKVSDMKSALTVLQKNRIRLLSAADI